MFKITAFYLTLTASISPLVANAEATQFAAPNDLRPLLSHLAAQCSPLPASLNEAALAQLQAFYQLREGQPAWVNDNQLNQLKEQLSQLADDGLNPADYPQPLLSQHATAHPDCAEILTTHGYLQALQHLRGGRIKITKAESLWRTPSLPPTDTGLATVSLAILHLAEPARAFAAARPSSTRYLSLRKAYAIQRQLPVRDWPTLASGKLLRANGTDERLPTLRARLEAEGYLSVTEEQPGSLYDSATQQALEHFQSAHGLNPDGVLGPASVRELNVPARQRLDQLRANLERLRWLADDLSISKVVINIPASELQIVQGDQIVWRTRTQVGRNDRQTPLLLSRLNRLTLNPTWTVPPTILRNDKLPAIRDDISYLSRHDLTVLDRNGETLDPALVDWENPGNIMLRQAAGTRNPLGRMAFRFDNPFSVYLHDTPSQSLFSKAPRAFSSGCVRVEAVDTLLSWLLSPTELEDVKSRIESGKTQQYRLQDPAVLLMAYWTTEANNDGALTYYPDIYERDQQLISALDAGRH
ncbi:L,D-transpeptidase family protein [Ectopseudomonas mendocina]|uniref:L,D-transpeptidase family protein n=1 Tax=Ectopseudomonas mendocina TaxID=300 RepID=A0ABZ2RJR6_ECTME